jgi:hypothetical protein
MREAGRARDLLVDARVVLHRARSQWVQSCINRYVQLRQPREVADHVDFRDLDLVQDFLAAQRRGKERFDRLLRHVQRRQLVAAPAGFRALEDERFHRGLLRGALRDLGFNGRGHLALRVILTRADGEGSSAMREGTSFAALRMTIIGVPSRWRR